MRLGNRLQIRPDPGELESIEGQRAYKSEAEKKVVIRRLGTDKNGFYAMSPLNPPVHLLKAAMKLMSPMPKKRDPMA